MVDHPQVSQKHYYDQEDAEKEQRAPGQDEPLGQLFVAHDRHQSQGDDDRGVQPPQGRPGNNPKSDPGQEPEQDAD